MTEFEIIERYFSFSRNAGGVITGIGDDAAIISSESHPIAISVDTLVAGVHFPLDASPADIGYKALAVNLSDMAAMAAEPRWFTLSLVLPDADLLWLEEFSESLAKSAQQHNIALIGGDTTRGPLSISIQIMGTVAEEGAVLRSTAQADQDIYVSGTLGDAAVGLLVNQNKITLNKEDRDFCLSRLHRPTPRLNLGYALRKYASAMIDCSDGFAADLGHILETSHIGAEVSFDSLPKSKAIKTWLAAEGIPELILTGGDDYELIFTASIESRAAIEVMTKQVDCSITRVGRTAKEAGLRVYDSEDQIMTVNVPGYNHFRSKNHQSSDTP